MNQQPFPILGSNPTQFGRGSLTKGYKSHRPMTSSAAGVQLKSRRNIGMMDSDTYAKTFMQQTKARESSSKRQTYSDLSTVGTRKRSKQSGVLNSQYMTAQPDDMPMVQDANGLILMAQHIPQNGTETSTQAKHSRLLIKNKYSSSVSHNVNRTVRPTRFMQSRENRENRMLSAKERHQSLLNQVKQQAKTSMVALNQKFMRHGPDLKLQTDHLGFDPIPMINNKPMPQTAKMYDSRDKKGFSATIKTRVSPTGQRGEQQNEKSNTTMTRLIPLKANSGLTYQQKHQRIMTNTNTTAMSKPSIGMQGKQVYGAKNDHLQAKSHTFDTVVPAGIALDTTLTTNELPTNTDVQLSRIQQRPEIGETYMHTEPSQETNLNWDQPVHVQRSGSNITPTMKAHARTANLSRSPKTTLETAMVSQIQPMQEFENAIWRLESTKAPQHAITMLKGTIRQRQSEGGNIRTAIRQADERNRRLLQETTELKVKTQQAESDCYEIRRDLSTYEANFLQHAYPANDGASHQQPQRFGTRLQAMLAHTNDARVKLSMDVRFDDVGRAYFCQSEQQEEPPVWPGETLAPHGLFNNIDTADILAAYGKGHSHHHGHDHAGHGHDSHDAIHVHSLKHEGHHHLVRVDHAAEENEKRAPVMQATSVLLEANKKTDHMTLLPLERSKRYLHGLLVTLGELRSQAPGSFANQVDDIKKDRLSQAVDFEMQKSQDHDHEEKDEPKQEELESLMNAVTGPHKQNVHLNAHGIPQQEIASLGGPGSRQAALLRALSPFNAGHKVTFDSTCSMHESSHDDGENLNRWPRVPPNEQYYRFKEISGKLASVRAQCIKGRIKGSVSLAKESVHFAFDFEPQLNGKFHEINVGVEVNRIMLELEMNNSGEQELRLAVMSRSRFLKEGPRRFSFICSLKGSMHQHSQLEIIVQAHRNTTSGSDYQQSPQSDLTRSDHESLSPSRDEGRSTRSNKKKSFANRVGLNFIVRTKVYQSQNVKKQELFSIEELPVEKEFSLSQVADLIGVQPDVISRAKQQGREEMLPLMTRLKNVIAQTMLLLRQAGPQNGPSYYVFIERTQCLTIGDDIQTRNVCDDRAGARDARQNWLKIVQQPTGEPRLSVYHTLLTKPSAERELQQESQEPPGTAVRHSDPDSLVNLMKAAGTKTAGQKRTPAPQLSPALPFVDDRQRSASALALMESMVTGENEKDSQPEFVELALPEEKKEVLITTSSLAKMQEQKAEEIEQLDEDAKEQLRQLRAKFGVQPLQPRRSLDYFEQQELLAQQLRTRRATELKEEGQNCAEIVHFLPLYSYNLNRMQRRYQVSKQQQVKLRRNQLRKVQDQEALFEQYFCQASRGKEARVPFGSRRAEESGKSRPSANLLSIGDEELLKDCRTRYGDMMEADQLKRKRKYHRKAKIFQKSFIQELQDKDKVIMEMAVPQAGTKRYQVLLLFFQIGKQLYLLLGREKVLGHKSETEAKAGRKSTMEEQANDCSHVGDSDVDELSMVSGIQGRAQKDDDSEYFVRILLDYTFIKHLEDPQFMTVDVNELAAKLDDLPKNQIFLDIVMNEIDQMFGQKFLLKKSTNQDGLADSDKDYVMQQFLRNKGLDLDNHTDHEVQANQGSSHIAPGMTGYSSHRDVQKLILDQSIEASEQGLPLKEGQTNMILIQNLLQQQLRNLMVKTKENQKLRNSASGKPTMLIEDENILRQSLDGNKNPVALTQSKTVERIAHSATFEDQVLQGEQSYESSKILHQILEEGTPRENGEQEQQSTQRRKEKDAQTKETQGAPGHIIVEDGSKPEGLEDWNAIVGQSTFGLGNLAQINNASGSLNTNDGSIKMNLLLRTMQSIAQQSSRLVTQRGFNQTMDEMIENYSVVLNFNS